MDYINGAHAGCDGALAMRKALLCIGRRSKTSLVTRRILYTLAAALRGVPPVLYIHQTSSRSPDSCPDPVILSLGPRGVLRAEIHSHSIVICFACVSPVQFLIIGHHVPVEEGQHQQPPEQEP